MRHDISGVTRWSLALGTFGAVCAALAAACGGSSNNDNGNKDGGSSAPPDGGSGALSDAGAVPCGFQQCNSGEVCCYNPLPACVAAGSCTGSTMACSSKGQCGSQNCCFEYQYADGGSADAGSYPSGFTSACQDTCGGSQVELCASSNDCSNGQTCVPYARYCAYYDGGAGNFFFDGGFFSRRDGGGGNQPNQAGADAGGTVLDAGTADGG